MVGTFCINVRVTAWPVRKQQLWCEQCQEGITYRVFAHPEGFLEFIVLQEEGCVTFRSQLLKIKGSGSLKCIFVVDGEDKKLYINGNLIKSLEESREESYPLIFQEEALEQVAAFLNPKSREACKKWIAWRRKELAKLISRNRGRLKTEEEQIAELNYSVHSLIFLIQAFQRGNLFLLGHLATEIRALVFWGRATYNPLLLRIAAMFDLPLPIYFIPPVSTNSHALLQEAKYFFQKSEPCLNNHTSRHIVADLQEYLMSEALSFNTGTRRRVISVNELIKGIATVLGASHYDPDIPPDLDFLRGLRNEVQGEMNAMVLSVAGVIADLGIYVLEKIDK